MRTGQLLLLALAAFAGPLTNASGFSEEYQACMEANGATAVVSMCMERELHLQEVRLEQALRKALEALTEERRSQLESLQERWEAYRNEKCRFLYHPASGSGGLLDMQQCLLDETRKRIEELEAICC